MDFEQAGQLIKNIREKELKITQEQFAEKMDTSPTTVYRLETANKKVTNVEIFMKFYQLTGYTVEEILLGKITSSNRSRWRKRLDFKLDTLSEDEFEYIYNVIDNLIRLLHKDKVRTLKDIKNDIKNKKEIN